MIKNFKELENILFSPKSNDLDLEKHFEFVICDEVNHFDDRISKKYLQVKIKSLSNEYSSHFIISSLLKFKKGQKYKIRVKDIKIQIIYFETFYELLNIEECNESSFSKFFLSFKTKSNYIMKNLIYASSLSELNYLKNQVIYMKLKFHEYMEIGANKNKYEFLDVNGDKIEIKSFSEKTLNELENNKIYYLLGIKFNEKSNSWGMINAFQIVQFNENNFQEYFVFNHELKKSNKIDKNNSIKDIKDNSFVNLEGKIISFILSKGEVKIKETETQNVLTLKLNYHLFRKIQLDNICKFMGFKNLGNSYYTFTGTSEIFTNKITNLIFYHLDYKSKNNKYDTICINNKEYRIDKEITEIKLNTEGEKTKFFKKITFSNSIDKKINKAYILEIDNGKIININNFVNKDGGFSYQINFQATKDNNLPKSYKIFLDDSEMEINKYDQYTEKKLRFNIINIPNQENSKNSQNKDINITIDKTSKNSLKLLYLINEENERKLYEFELEKKNIDIFSINDFHSKIISTFYDKYFNSNKIEYPKISEETYKILETEINKDDTQFQFSNKKSDFEFIKKLTFFMLCFKLKNTNQTETDVILELTKYKKLLIDSQNLDYDERINILLFYFNKKFNDIDKDFTFINFSFESQKLVDNFKNNEDENIFQNEIKIDEDEPFIKEKNYPFFKSYFIFLEIIDGLNENSLLFHYLQTFNSLILFEKNIKNSMFSGNILDKSSIKLELFHLIHPYLFFENSTSKHYAFYSIPFKQMCIDLKLILQTENYGSLSSKKKKNLTAAIIFLYFHEFCGHSKTHSNNDEKTPRYIYSQELELINFGDKFDKIDSGFIIEYILTGDSISIETIYNSDNSIKLLNRDLYIKNNFNDLKIILQNIPHIFENEPKSDNDSNLFNNSNDVEKIIKKYKGKLLGDRDYFAMSFKIKKLKEEDKKKLEKTSFYKSYLDYMNAEFKDEKDGSF